MSRSNQYTILTENSSVGAPVGEFSIEVDIATMGATKDIQIHDRFSMFAKTVSCQVVATGLTGTLDGTVQLIQSNDEETFDNIVPAVTTLDAADRHDTLEKVDFSGKIIGATIAKVGLTGGTVKLIFIVKHQ